MATKRTTGASRSGAAGPRRTPAAGTRPRIYVYCIAQSSSPPTLRVQGLPDAGPPRAVPLGRSRWILVADVPASRFNETALAAGLQDLDWVGVCAMAHDALVMDAMKNGPVVPMRLFTIFDDEPRALAQAQLAAKQIARTLRRVAGRAEYGVRAGVMPAARRQARAPVPRLTGRSFLEQKRRQLEARRAVGGVPDSERERIFDRLARLADEARRRQIPEGGSVWFDGAFLVPLSGAAAFRREVNRLSTELAKDGHEVVLTGPWPPYSFLDDYGAQN